jgi:hypothetical protein
MKSILNLSVLFLFLSFLSSSCEKDSSSEVDNNLQMPETKFIADYTVAKEEILRAIPETYIDKAREELRIAYQHTSHGTHVSYGIFGLQDYKSGDNTLFAVTNYNQTVGKLDFRDNTLSSYATTGENASDLSVNETAFIQATRNYLDDEDNAEINVVMWSWCDISGHDVADNYLPGMQTLINEYAEGGSKIGSGTGQRLNAVTFIFMTGHANEGNNVGDGKPKNQAELITNFCETNKYMCLDYYSIDSHCMNDNYWEDVNDDGESQAYGGNFYTDWQSSHILGQDYYENKTSPNGSVSFGQHNTQHITANRKAYAFWWILARIAGWDGESSK